MTVFGLHTPAQLFVENEAHAKDTVRDRTIAALNRYLEEPLEDCLALDRSGMSCVEVKTPLDLEREIALPRGNIGHKDLSFPFASDRTHGRWGVETSHPRIFLAGAGAIRGGGVSGIPGHNAAKAVLER